MHFDELLLNGSSSKFYNLIFRKEVVMAFENFFAFMESFAFFEVFLPFIVIFAIVFGVLNKIQMFPKNINVVLAFAMGAMTVVPHIAGVYPECWDIVNIINGSLPKVGFMILAILMFIVVVSVLGVKMEFFANLSGIFAIGAFIFVVMAFLTSTNCVGFDIGFDDTLLGLLPFLVAAGLIWFVIRIGKR